MRRLTLASPDDASRAPLRAGGLTAIACAAVLAVPTWAAAHTELTGTTPVDGRALKSAPAVVVATYSEPLAGVVEASVTVEGVEAGGAQRARLAPADAARLRIPIATDAGYGRFRVQWVVRSADAHLLGGSLAFTVARPSLRDDVARLVRAILRAVEALSTRVA